jgi:hypothetical protein
MAEHNVLTGNALHEPKGVELAPANAVYHADGAGSGTWHTVAGGFNTRVSVASLADLPAPVSSVITLADNTKYELDGSVQLGTNRLACGSNTYIIGVNATLDGLVYDGSEACITTASSIGLINIHIRTTHAASQVIAATGTNIDSINVEGVQSLASGTIGNINTQGNIVLRDTALAQADMGGLVITGNGKRLLMSGNHVLNWTGIALDITTATFETISITDGNLLEVAAGTTGVAGAINSVNLTGDARGLVTGNTFTGAGTYVTGITSADLKWHMAGNQGVFDSASIGGLTKDAIRTDTVLATGLATKIAGSSTLSSESERFTDSGLDNHLTYIGLDSQRVNISGTITGRSAGGSSITCNLVIRRAGGDTPVVTGIVFPTASDATYTFSYPGFVEPDDFAELYLTRTVGSQNFDCVYYQLNIVD